MKRLIKIGLKIGKYLLLTIVFLVLVIIMIGGGFGPKEFDQQHRLYQNDLMLIAHRGVASKAPENSRAAFNAAHNQGFDAVEIDIKETQDGHFYLFHDRSSDRLLNTTIDLSATTLAELKQFPLYFEGAQSNQYILSLEEFGREFSKDFIVYLDIKRHGNDHYEYLAKKIWQFISTYDLQERVFVGSDFLFTVYLEYNYPQVHTVFSGPGDSTAHVYLWIPKKFRPDFMISYADEVTDRHIDWLRKNGLMNRRMVYGVNEGNYDRLMKWGIPKVMVDQ
ncbi:MAG: glycerophosphodiester phosphodiesterase [Cyclobacteriaceae bacterium]